MKREMAVWLVILVLAAASAAAQSMADAAKPIGEERTRKGLIIDNSSLTKSPRSATASVDDDWLMGAVEECAESVRDLNIVLTETASSSVFFDPQWQTRVVDGARRFEAAESDFRNVDADERYEAALLRMREGLDQAATAINALVAAIENDQPLYSNPKKELLAASRIIESAFSDIRGIRREEEREAPAPAIDPIAAGQSITAVCSRWHGPETDGYDSCIAAQRAAINEITFRGAPGSGLDVPRFNSLRNTCRFEYPDDFVGRNRCEQQRIAAATSR